MGWFDEQIKERKASDDRALEDTYLHIAGSVMGRRLSASLNDKRIQAQSAIEDILKYYGVKYKELPGHIKDMDEVLEYLLRPSGIMTREVYLERGWRNDAAGAMLATMKEDGSVVALIPSKIRGYIFIDPKTGLKVKINSKNEQLIDREAYAFYKPFPMSRLKVSSLLGFIWDNIEKSDLLWYAFFVLVVTLIGLLVPWFNKQLFSTVLESESMRVLTAIAIFMICTSISNTLFGTVKSLVLQKISLRLDMSVEAATMMRILSLPPSFFKDYASGELSNRSQYINSLVTMLVNAGLSAGLTSIFSLIYIGQIFKYTPGLVVPALAVTIITVVFSIITALIQIRISRERMEATSKESGMGYALVSGIQKIRLAGAEKRAFSRWGHMYAKEAKYMYDPPLILKVNPVISVAVSFIGTMVIYYDAVIQKVSVSDYYAFNSAYAMMSGAFMTLSGIAVTLAQIRPILDMARPIMEAEPEISGEKAVLERLSGGIEFNNVSFRYDENMPLVLNDISFKIKPGEYVAIVGKTGCGKSTLLRLMLGFETPQKGAVYYDGRDIKSFDLKSLRSRIGTVMQDGKLFQGDIYSNIVISAPQLPMDAAWEAAELAGIADDIREMPMGMFTVISEGQGGISGGQKQRLMIARAIAPKPKILIFDEATSALDNITQKKVSESLDSLNCTRIVIAHRLSTIRHCDRILVIDGGGIIEEGTYDELINRNGFFADLVARQQINSEES
ncbi:MAG: NHLP bacteriocin export ABC transporter permease/ATPase subunit [Lachnospiraceae bacterium]|nr:NHLP bacteriocin export ABC transporter permease/ATPase subunit [Lachnospiraceae bacterium]